MTDPKTHTDALDVFFQAAKADRPLPEPQFMAQLHADAQAAVVKPVIKSRSWIGTFRDVLDQFGGWTAGAGLAAATVAGIAVGINPPESVLDVTTAYLSTESFSDLTGLAESDTYFWEES